MAVDWDRIERFVLLILKKLGSFQNLKIALIGGTTLAFGGDFTLLADWENLEVAKTQLPLQFAYMIFGLVVIAIFIDFFDRLIHNRENKVYKTK